MLSGSVSGVEELIARTPQQFRDRFRVDVRTRHEVVGLDLDARRVEVRALDQHRTLHLGFDQLHIATGARPVLAIIHAPRGTMANSQGRMNKVILT